MRALIICGSLIGLLLSAMGVAAYFGIVFFTSQTADQLSTAEREPIERAALAVANGMQEGDPEAVYESMSVGGRASASVAQIMQLASNVRALRRAGDYRVADICRLQVWGFPKPDTLAACPKANVRVQVGANAHVLVEDRLESGWRVTEVWLVQEKGKWRPFGFYVGNTGVGSWSREDVWRVAREQRALGHRFNATLLFIVAEQSMQLGPFYAARNASDFLQAEEGFEPVPELRGQAPYEWALSSRRDYVNGVLLTPTLDGHLLLDIHRTSPILLSEAEAEEQNRGLIEAFNKAYPEWKEIVDALVVRTQMPSGALLGSVFLREGGYLDGPAPTDIRTVTISPPPSPSAPS